MRTNATSGPTFSLYLTIVLVMVLVFGNDRVYAKRGCSAFGHSCFGGHGKRFDPQVHDNTLQAANSLPSWNSRAVEISSPNDELFLVLPNDKFRERPERSSIRTRQDAQHFDPYTLSFFVDQWLASHRRPHRTDLEVANK